MATECEICGNYFTLGINGGTCVGDNGTEGEVCDYCKDVFFEQNS